MKPGQGTPAQNRTSGADYLQLGQDLAPVKVLCLPFAGAGPSFFHPWQALGYSGLEIQPLALPGRERLLASKPFTDLQAAADALVPQVRNLVEDQPFALLGHCFLGSVLAYQLARRLAREAGLELRHLFVSASRSPRVRRPYGSARLSDDEFLALVQQITGYRHEALDVPEIRELLLPALRADFAMDEGYEHGNPEQLALPVTAVSARDDRLVSRYDVQAWSEVAAGQFEVVEVAGGHMYLADDPRPLLDIVSARLGPPGAGLASHHTVQIQESQDAFAW